MKKNRNQKTEGGWQGLFDNARKYYEESIARAQGGFSEVITLANKRLQELNEGRKLEYNLKMFLNACLLENSARARGGT